MASFLTQKEIEELINRLNPDVAETVKTESTPGNGAGTGALQEEAAPAQEIKRVVFPELSKPLLAKRERDIHFFEKVPVTLTLELAGATMTVRDILNLHKGSVMKLDKLAGENAALCVNGRPLAGGEIVVINENFGFRVLEIGDKNGERAKEHCT